MPSFLLKIGLVGYFYLMIYKPEFVFIPISDNTFFGLLGFCYYLFQKRQRNEIIRNSSAFFSPILSLYIPVLLISFISMLINQTEDYHYISYVFSLVLYYFMAYLGAVGFYKIYGEITPRILLKYYVIVALIHVFLSLAMFANSYLNDFMMSLLKQNDFEKEKLAITLGSRLQGFGAFFYTSGLINGFILILIGIELFLNKGSVLFRVFLTFSFVAIFVIGIMIARTIMIGAFLGLLIIIYGMYKDAGHTFKNIAIYASASIFVFLLGIVTMSRSGIDFEYISEFGFEYITKIQDGDTSSHSSDRMIEMYDVRPDNIKTWIIGDCMWQEGNHYYKRVDIGFLRNVFYFGALGSFLLYLYNYLVLRKVFFKRKLFQKYSYSVVLVLFIYTMILNLKGTVDLFYYVLPFYFCFNKK